MGRSSTEPEKEDLERIHRQYRTIRDELVATPIDELGHQLSSLIRDITETSRRDDTIRFLVGVSFTRNYTPLDYHLDRIVETENDGRHVEEVKAAISQNHRYLRFSYPADPEFDAPALRGALLASLDRELRDLERTLDRAGTDDSISDLWRLLANRK